MGWPDSDRDRLDAAHRAIRVMIGQLQAAGQMDPVGFALAEDGEAASEVLAATGRLDSALDHFARRQEHRT